MLTAWQTLRSYSKDSDGHNVLKEIYKATATPLSGYEHSTGRGRAPRNLQDSTLFRIK